MSEQPKTQNNPPPPPPPPPKDVARGREIKGHPPVIEKKAGR